jgi:cysteine dioxygenase
MECNHLENEHVQVMQQEKGTYEDLPQPHSLEELIDFLNEYGEPLSKQDPTILASVLANMEISKENWAPYSFFDFDKRYTRNLVHSDNRTYTLMLLCWTPDKESPIHDHPCDGCWVRVLEGTIFETRYEENVEENCLEQTCHMTAEEGEACFINDSMGLHKIGSENHGMAVTLHLYMPPYSQCRAWLTEDCPATKFCRPCVSYYSVRGERNEHCAGGPQSTVRQGRHSWDSDSGYSSTSSTDGSESPLHGHSFSLSEFK